MMIDNDDYIDNIDISDNDNSNKLTVDEWRELYDKTTYWVFKFPSQILWLILAFFVSFIANGGHIIRVLIVAYLIFGTFKYFYYKEIWDDFPKLF